MSSLNLVGCNFGGTLEFGVVNDFVEIGVKHCLDRALMA